jgi:ribA/ribD-fused uncharacterized protein
MKITNDYVFFWGGVFSQWYSCNIVIDNIEYNCAEQYMMVEKARLFKDIVAEAAIMHASTPKHQKAIGRTVKNFDELAWHGIARTIVYTGNWAKFTQNEQLLDDLLKTGRRVIVEASPCDRIWGIGLKENDNRCLDKSQWQGKNWLGEILTKVRDDLSKTINESLGIEKYEIS